MAKHEIRLNLNGQESSIQVDPSRSLLCVLRDELGLTGTKYGCGEGQCGACTVLAGGEPVRACQLPVGEVGARPIVTVEGLAPDGTLSPVQQAFAELGAFQCGFCTPGMVVNVTALLHRTARPSLSEIRTALEPNLCRCGGYSRILKAVERAAELSREGRPES